MMNIAACVCIAREFVHVKCVVFECPGKRESLQSKGVLDHCAPAFVRQQSVSVCH